MDSLKKTGRISGFLYLLQGITAGYALSFRGGVFVPGDAVATAGNILSHVVQFRVAIAVDLLAQVIQIFLALALFELLKAVDRKQAVLMALLVLIAVPIAMLNQVNQFAALSLLTNADLLKIYTEAQLQGQAMVFMDMFGRGIQVAAIFWGLWLLPLGYLVFKSGFIPRILGVFLIIAGVGYVFDSFAKLILPHFNLEIAMYTFIGEVLFLFWLLIKGANVKPEG
jgi:hypothetical protein